MKFFLCLIACIFLTACVPQNVKQDNSAFEAAAPRSILVVPIINKSLDVDASNYMLATLPIPIAEKGYYVFPVNTTKFILEQEGLYEAERIRQMPASELAKMFGADAVLYVTINRWDAQYAFITTTVTVGFEYEMVTRDGNKIWGAEKTMKWSPQNSNSGPPLAVLIGALVNAAVARAAPNYLPLTQQANNQVFVMGPTAIPDGPYRVKQQ